MFIYIWAGPHHLHYTALPAWASTLGMLFCLMLWMPSWGGMINGLMTLRGAWNKVATDPVLKFFVVAVTFYGMATFEGPLLAIKSVNALSHYTDWTIGHVHAGTLGWSGLMTFGMVYWLLPRLFQTKLWSTHLANWHFWLGTIGIFSYWLSMYAAGMTQGLMWCALDQSGSLANPDFVETVMRLVPLYWIRTAGGSLFLIGVFMLALNFLMTWRNRPKKYEIEEYEAYALDPNYTPPPTYKSDLGSVLAVGRTMDEITHPEWHRRWEGKPVKFTVFVLIAVVVASLFEAVPTWLVEANRQTIPQVMPYTPLELAGRDVYISEGCYVCHSQMVRPMRHETERFGRYSEAGDFVYDHPFQWGSRRIGPDLHRVGGVRNHLWHWDHFRNPRDVTQNSIMPNYESLLKGELNFEQIRSRVRAMTIIDVPYDTDTVTNSVEMTRAQASQIARELLGQGGPPVEQSETKKVIALIAYLQRLGTDILKPPPEEDSSDDEGGE